MMQKVLLAEDHLIVTKGLKILFEAEFKGYALHCVTSGEGMMHSLRMDDYILAIVDLQLEDGGSIHLIPDILKLYPGLKLLVFSANPEELYAQALYLSGVKGYLSKRAEDAEIVHAIKQVLNGETYLSKGTKQLLLDRNFKQDTSNPFTTLSQRELEITSLLTQGKSSSEIGSQLNLQSSTVATHKMNIFKKIKVNNAFELSEKARVFNFKNKAGV